MTPTAATRPREPLSRDRVVATAVGLADEDGIEGLSMRKLAQSLGVSRNPIREAVSVGGANYGVTDKLYDQRLVVPLFNDANFQFLDEEKDPSRVSINV